MCVPRDREGSFEPQITGAFDRGAANTIIGKGPGRAGSLECRELQIKVLFRGGNPRIPGHAPGRTAILLIPNNLPL